MAAGGEIEAEEGVARLHQREERRDVGGSAGVRLDIGKARAEQLLHALDRQRLGNVDVLAAAVIAPARQAFGILVGEHRALRLEHRAADDVLGRDQLDLVALAAELLADRLGDLRDRRRQGGWKTANPRRFSRRIRTWPWGSPGVACPTISTETRQGLDGGRAQPQYVDFAPNYSRLSRIRSFCRASLLQVGLGRARRPHCRDLDAGQAVDGGHLHRIADRGELEIDITLAVLGHELGLLRRLIEVLDPVLDLDQAARRAACGPRPRPLRSGPSRSPDLKSSA